MNMDSRMMEEKIGKAEKGRVGDVGWRDPEEYFPKEKIKESKKDHMVGIEQEIKRYFRYVVYKSRLEGLS